jgi:hypothetical protein
MSASRNTYAPELSPISTWASLTTETTLNRGGKPSVCRRLSSLVAPRAPQPNTPNAGHQLRPAAGAPRTLDAVACMPWFGARLRACLIRGNPCEAADHEMDHRHSDHGLARLNEILVIFAQPTIAVEPAQRAFHNPPLGQDEKPFGRGRPGDNLQSHRVMHAQGFHPLHESARISLIGPDAA